MDSGTLIESDWANQTLQDVAQALTQSIARDGQTAVTANLPMSGNRHTGVGNATAANQYGVVRQIQGGEYNVAASVSGTNSITASLNPPLPDYSPGMSVVLKPANSNTGAVTLSLNGLTPRNVVTLTGEDIVRGDLVAGYPALFLYDETNTRWILVNPASFYRLMYRHHIITNGESPYQAVPGDDVMVDVSGGAVTVTLPAGPVITDQPVNITHIAGDVNVNALTIGRNSQAIMGLNQDLVINYNLASVMLAFSDASRGWRVRVVG